MASSTVTLLIDADAEARIVELCRAARSHKQPTLDRIEVVVGAHPVNGSTNYDVKLDGAVIGHTPTVPEATLLVCQLLALLDTGVTVTGKAYEPREPEQAVERTPVPPTVSDRIRDALHALINSRSNRDVTVCCDTVLDQLGDMGPCEIRRRAREESEREESEYQDTWREVLAAIEGVL